MSQQKEYKVPNVATDAIVLRPKTHDEEPKDYDIALITRKNDPFKGCYAFPGGFVDYNEDPQDACIRELHEECGIPGSHPTLVTVAGNPKRDPRKHIISIVYHVQCDPHCCIKPGDDASTAAWYDLKEVWENKDGKMNLAFDHKDILKEFLIKFHPQFLKQ